MAFFGLIVFLIFVYWRPQDFIAYLLNFRFIFGIMVMTIFFWILERMKEKRSDRIFVFSLDYAVLMFYVMIVISTYNYHWLKYTMDIIIDFGKLLIFYILITNCINTRRRLNVFFYFLSVLTFLIAGVAILQRFGIDLMGVGMINGDRIQGAGIYNNPNYLAYSVALILPIQYFIFNRYKLFPVRIMNFFIFITSYICIFLTKSRGGILCALGITAFMFAQRKKVWVKYMVLVFTVLMLALVTSIAPRFSSLNREQGSIQDRIAAWYSGLEMLKQHPVIGVGVGLFNDYHKGKTAHSSFVLAGAETGFLGLFAWVAMIYFSMKLLESKNVAGRYQNQALALEASVLGYFICSFSVTFTYRIIFFIICGLISALLRIDLKEKALLLADKRHALGVLMERKRTNVVDLRNIFFVEIFLIIVWHLVIKNR